jgi:hypothetical protein
VKEAHSVEIVVGGVGNRSPENWNSFHDRATRLGDFSPIGRFFAYWAIVNFGQFVSKLKKIVQNWGLLFKAVKLMH